MRDRPRDEPRKDAGRNRKEERRAQYSDRSPHGTAFLSCRNVNAANSDRRVQRLNRDALAKASRPSPQSSSSGIRVASAWSELPRSASSVIARSSKSPGQWDSIKGHNISLYK